VTNDGVHICTWPTGPFALELNTRRNVVNSNHFFATNMQLTSKLTDFTTSSVLVLHVH